jgi:hypothetical protein
LNARFASELPRVFRTESEADGRVYVLAGEDDEVRAVAVTIPLSAVHEVLALAGKEL